MKVADIKIEKKMWLLSGATIVQLVCLTGIAWWAIHALTAGLEDTQKEERREVLAMNVSRHANSIGLHVANAVLANRFDDDTMERIQNLRKEYMGSFEELSALSYSPEDKRREQALQAVIQQWREADNTLIQTVRAGKQAEALTFYRKQVVPRLDDLRATLDDFLGFRRRQMDNIQQHVAAEIRQDSVLLLGFGFFWLAGSAILGRSIGRLITKPISQAVEFLENVAKGDLTRDTHAENLARRDEVGALAVAMQSMTVSLRGVIQEVSDGIHVLSSSSTELSANSGQMSSGGRTASEKAHSVAAAAEEMTANVISVSAGMEQTTTNLTSVASATEQMTATIGEIAANSEKARRITEEATRQAGAISEQMNHLGVAAQQIGKVTETITEISSQTNLLALNATIEAARAGSAGKGFAVVANEIKELAQQTAAATEDIKARIEGVQSSTAAGIAEIGKVSKVIHDVSDIVSSIAAAIEEQATVTKDIARNIGEATTGVRDANVRVSESSQATENIAREISSVDHAAREVADGSEQVRSSAADLSNLAERLQSTISRFHLAGSPAPTRG